MLPLATIITCRPSFSLNSAGTDGASGTVQGRLPHGSWNRLRRRLCDGWQDARRQFRLRAFIGTYVGEGDSIKVKISTQRYNDDPSFKPLFGHNRITLTLAGREDGDTAEFEGTALQVPGVAFRAVLSRISD
ncbi:hypothetical protein ACVW0J_004929 [Bradyrhizobium sp. i1.7.7]